MTTQRTGFLLTPVETADLLKLSVGHLANLRSQQKGIPYIKVGGNAVRYRLADILDWLDDNTVYPKEGRS